MRILEHRFEHIPQESRRGRAWLASLLPLFEGALATEAVVPEDAFLRYHHLGAIVLAVERGPAQVVTRSPERVQSQVLDHLVLRAHAGGPVRIEAGAWVGEAAGGDLILFDLAQPLRIAMPPQTGIAIVVPRRLMAEATEDVVPRHGQVLPGASVPLARLLAAHLCHLADALETATPAQVGDLVPATLALCRAIVRSARCQSAACQNHEAGGGRTELAREVRRYIDAHLVTINLAGLIQRFGLSRRSLYRLFAETGGVETFIRERRLAHALRVLAASRRRPKLARLAHDCGFADAQVFSRAFKRRYGLSPMRVEPGSAPIAAASESGLLGWLRDL
ncbi:helix-turn-helix domain-containing protein [Methylorubrum sp. DB1722]|uniref:helix-turn-helix domain-containing protein n=1 Tax=Methylorubrum sp. DB1722 TaxID=2478916 RepID=UPI0018E3EE76|nr:helix-turn-helix domain-containing protein [Methylorubrum sp. DB1722]MBI1689653.1 helix-turn-helix domain-containing protein [Methylorubrum sp. DB1722]